MICVYLQRGRNGDSFCAGRGQVTELFLSEGIERRDQLDYSPPDVNVQAESKSNVNGDAKRK